MLGKYFFLALAAIAPIQKCSSNSSMILENPDLLTIANAETTALQIQNLFTQALAIADLKGKNTFSRSKVLGRIDTILEENINDFDLALRVFDPQSIHIVYNYLRDLRRSVCRCPWWCCCSYVDEEDGQIEEQQREKNIILKKGQTFYRYLQTACESQMYEDQFHTWRQETEKHLRTIKRAVTAMDTRKMDGLEIQLELAQIIAINPAQELGQSIIQLRNAFYDLNK
ncbi:MAG: hypothetical protein LBJ89_00670 [Holosporales bacterium]|jgi:hypothetical protein|nr:hypothetical protein [Holosporales bacterium]